MGRPLGSRRDPRAGDEEPKLLRDAKAVPAEAADGVSLVLGGKQQVGEALRLAENS